MSDPAAWRPEQYERFSAERSWPFYDLLDLVRPVPHARLVDLGCGTGALTEQLHQRLEAAETLGIDHSPTMLEKAAPLEGAGLHFEKGDIASFAGSGFDVVFSNAALHWLPDHPAVLRRWTAALVPRGQLAVQVPANTDHPATLLGVELAHESPFLEAFGGNPPPEPTISVLDPSQYSQLLYDLGFEEQHVRLQVYGHVLASTAEVVEWAKGTGLTRFQAPLGPELFDRYIERYRERLIALLGWSEPFLFTFKRVLFWGRRAEH
jgi:trans-aconitate 2-methyltransferase